MWTPRPEVTIQTCYPRLNSFRLASTSVWLRPLQMDWSVLRASDASCFRPLTRAAWMNRFRADLCSLYIFGSARALRIRSPNPVIHTLFGAPTPPDWRGASALPPCLQERFLALHWPLLLLVWKS